MLKVNTTPDVQYDEEFLPSEEFVSLLKSICMFKTGEEALDNYWKKYASPKERYTSSQKESYVSKWNQYYKTCYNSLREEIKRNVEKAVGSQDSSVIPVKLEIQQLNSYADLKTEPEEY